MIFDIAVDGREIEKGTRRTGLSRYLISFLRTLGDRGKSVLVLSDKNTDKEFIAQLLHEKVAFADVNGGAVCDQVLIPIKILGKSKVYFSVYPKFPIIFPLAGIRTIILVADLINFSIFQKMFLKFFGRLPHKIIVISEYWKKEIEKFTGRDTIKVLLDLSYVKTSGEIRISPKDLEAFGIYPKKYLLYVGNFNPHKNVGVLISAFERISGQTDLQLVLVGGGGRNAQKIEERVKYNTKVKIINSPNDELLFALVREAFACVFPSLMEGLGLPMIESAFFGKAMILSDIEPFREISGDMAIFFDPSSPHDLAMKILKLYHNQELKIKLELRAQKVREKFLSFSTGEQIYEVVFG